MLLYSNRSHVRLIFQLRGSVVFGDWRQILFGLLLAGVTVFLTYLIKTSSQFAPEIPDNYGAQLLGMVVAFATVFRVNLAWQRYWEALTSVHNMYSKWGDAFMQFATFCACSIAKAQSANGDGGGQEEKLSKLQVAFDDCQKYFSLLSAMASDEIHHGDVQQMDMRLNGGRRSGQVIRAESMRETDRRPVPTLKEGHASAQSFSESFTETLYVVKKLPWPAEVGALEMTPDRVHLCVCWIVKTMAMVQAELGTPPPIQSRMYQEISNGYVHFTNAKKISDVPFPFNYAQLNAIILIVFDIMLPVYVSAFTQSYIAGPILTFVICHSINCTNELAEILENPFGVDMDDISLEDFHMRFLQMMEVTTAALDVSLHPELYVTESTSCRRFASEEGLNEDDSVFEL